MTTDPIASSPSAPEGECIIADPHGLIPACEPLATPGELAKLFDLPSRFVHATLDFNYDSIRYLDARPARRYSVVDFQCVLADRFEKIRRDVRERRERHAARTKAEQEAAAARRATRAGARGNPARPKPIASSPSTSSPAGAGPSRAPAPTFPSAKPAPAKVSASARPTEPEVIVVRRRAS